MARVVLERQRPDRALSSLDVSCVRVDAVAHGAPFLSERLGVEDLSKVPDLDHVIPSDIAPRPVDVHGLKAASTEGPPGHRLFLGELAMPLLHRPHHCEHASTVDGEAGSLGTPVLDVIDEGRHFSLG